MDPGGEATLKFRIVGLVWYGAEHEKKIFNPSSSRLISRERMPSNQVHGSGASSAAAQPRKRMAASVEQEGMREEFRAPGHLAIDTMDADCERVLSSAEHHSESVREDVRLKLRHAKARLIAIV